MKRQTGNLRDKGRLSARLQPLHRTSKKDYTTYTTSEWEWADKRYDLYTGDEYDFYKGTFTDAEKEEIGRLKGAYAKIKIKKTAGAMKEGLKDMFSTGKGVIKGLLE